MKYCPVCDTHYSDSHDRCSVCGVELIPESLRGRPLNEKERREPIELVWRGGDPVAVSQALAALRAAGIQHHLKSTNDHLVFELGMPRPKYEIRVFASDAEGARQLLAGITESLPFAISEIPDLSNAAEAKAEEDKREHAPAWKPAAATVAIWEGDDSALARVLEDCLRENNIGFRREGREPGQLRLFVMPGDADPACEILREVLEASPPE